MLSIMSVSWLRTTSLRTTRAVLRVTGSFCRKRSRNYIIIFVGVCGGASRSRSRSFKKCRKRQKLWWFPIAKVSTFRSSCSCCRLKGIHVSVIRFGYSGGRGMMSRSLFRSVSGWESASDMTIFRLLLYALSFDRAKLRLDRIKVMGRMARIPRSFSETALAWSRRGLQCSVEEKEHQLTTPIFCQEIAK